MLSRNYVAKLRTRERVPRGERVMFNPGNTCFEQRYGDLIDEAPKDAATNAVKETTEGDRLLSSTAKFGQTKLAMLKK